MKMQPTERTNSERLKSRKYVNLLPEGVGALWHLVVGWHSWVSPTRCWYCTSGGWRICWHGTAAGKASRDRTRNSSKTPIVCGWPSYWRICKRRELKWTHSGLNTGHAEAKSGLEFGLLQLVMILILFQDRRCCTGLAGKGNGFLMESFRSQ